MVTPFIFIFTMPFEGHLGDVIDTILVARVVSAAEREEETDRQTLEKCHFHLLHTHTLVAYRLSYRTR